MSELSDQTVRVTFQETIDWGGIPITIDCGDQSVLLVVTDCCDPFPAMLRWLEAITTGVQCCSFDVDEEGSDKRFTLEQTCNGSRFSIVDKYYEAELFIRSEVDPAQLVQAFYVGLVDYARSPLYIKAHWHDKTSLLLGCNLSELKSLIIENWLSERRPLVLHCYGGKKVTPTLALQIATQAHRGQTDKLGNDYITHPTRIAATFVDDPDLQSVGFLHDVLEDSSMTEEDLRELFPVNIVDAVVAITKKDGQSYDEYLGQVKANEMALAVKLADIEDNVSRLDQLTDSATRERLTARYQYALWVLSI